MIYSLLLSVSFFENCMGGGGGGGEAHHLHLLFCKSVYGTVTLFKAKDVEMVYI